MRCILQINVNSSRCNTTMIPLDCMEMLTVGQRLMSYFSNGRYGASHHGFLDVEMDTPKFEGELLGNRYRRGVEQDRICSAPYFLNTTARLLPMTVQCWLPLILSALRNCPNVNNKCMTTAIYMSSFEMAPNGTFTDQAR